MDLIREDPYVLAEDIPGAGFLIADTVARKLGVEIEDPERVRACIMHIVLQNADDGHTFAERAQTLRRDTQISRVQVQVERDSPALRESIPLDP